MAGKPPPSYWDCVYENQACTPDDSDHGWTVYCREGTDETAPSSEKHIDTIENLQSEEKRRSVQPQVTILMWFVVTLLGISGLVFPVHAVFLTVLYMLIRGIFGLMTLDAAIPKVEHPKPPSLVHFTFDIVGYLWYTLTLGSTTFLITNVPFRYTALLADRCTILVVDTLFVIVALRLRFFVNVRHV